MGNRRESQVDESLCRAINSVHIGAWFCKGANLSILALLRRTQCSDLLQYHVFILGLVQLACHRRLSSPLSVYSLISLLYWRVFTRLQQRSAGVFWRDALSCPVFPATGPHVWLGWRFHKPKRLGTHLRSPTARACFAKSTLRRPEETLTSRPMEQTLSSCAQ